MSGPPPSGAPNDHRRLWPGRTDRRAVLDLATNAVLAVVLVPLLAALALGRWGPPLANALPPRRALRLLTGSALIVALATGLALYSLAVPVIARVPQVAAIGRWVPGMLHSPGPLWFGLAAGMVATMLLLGGILAGVRAAGTAIVTTRSTRGFRTGYARVSVVPDDMPSAYAIGLRGGQVVVTTAMLAALSAPEQRVLLAHEEAHLRQRHSAHLVAIRLAVAANPLLGPLERAVRHAAERAADEYAAGVVGDRLLAARSVARAATARRARQRAETRALDVAGGDVPARVDSLLSPPRHGHSTMCASVVVATVLVAYCSLTVADWAQDQLAHARSSFASSVHDVRPASDVIRPTTR